MSTTAIIGPKDGWHIKRVRLPLTDPLYVVVDPQGRECGPWTGSLGEAKRRLNAELAAVSP